MTEKLENLKKQKEVLLKKITELEQLEQQKQEKKIKDKQRRELELSIAKKLKEEKHRDMIRAKRINLFHLNIDAKLIKNISNAISDIQDEAVFSLKKKQIEYIGVDPAHVALYTITIPSSSLKEYTCKTDHNIGIDITKLNKVLSRRKVKGKKSNSKITIDEYEEDGSLHLSWKTEYGLYKRSSKMIDTATIPIAKMPNLLLPMEFIVDTTHILEFLKEADDISDYFSITTSNSGVRFEASSDIANMEYILPDKKYKTYRSIFSIDYFYNAILSMNLFFKQITIKISTDNPVEIRGKGAIEMMILLAPRIHSE